MASKQKITHYDGLDEFHRDLDKPRQWSAKTSQDTNENADGWTGTKTYADAEHLFRNGYPEGREMLARTLNQAARCIRTTHRSETLDVAGFNPVVPVWIAGDPACYQVFGEDARATKPTVRFSVSISASWNVSKEVMAHRGAAIMSWIDALEDLGTRCELTVQFVDRLNDGVYGFTLMLKRADEHLDVDRATYALIHASMLRRQTFQWLETNTPKSAENFGYGTPTDLDEPEPGSIVFGRMLGSEPYWKTVQAAVEHIRAQIDNAGLLPEELKADADAAD